MEQYDLMYNIVDNPESNVMDFKLAGFNAENTTLKDISVYLEDPYIKELFTENGIFLESKVREAYDNASIMYNIMATDSYNEYIKLSIPWGKYNTDVDPSLRSQGPRYTMIAESNPMHIAWSMLEIGLAGLPAFSPSELAQTENILTNPSEVFANGEDNPDWSVAIWDDSPNETFFSNFFTPLVLAQYDSDGTHIDPITGQQVEHTKGSLKLNQNGDYYYEYLDGRDIYGRLVLNKTDIITTDGSWLNQFDFFDCDDINQKSFIGTVMRNLTLVGTMFIPGIGPWVTLLGMIPLLATMTATLGKMIVGSDSPNLSALEGWGKHLDKFGASTEYAKEHPWCLENLVNLMGMVAGQLQELRMFFEYVPAIFKGLNMYNEATSKAVLAKFAEEEAAVFSKRAKDLSALASRGSASMQEMLQLSNIQNILKDNSVFKTYVETAAQARMTLYMKNYNKIGSILSKGYMTMLTVQDTYGEAKLAGASDAEAVALTCGYAFGEAMILNTGIGEWILPELRYEREFNKQVIRTLFKDNMATVKKLEDQFLKKGMASSTPLKRSFFKEVFKIGNSLAEESSVVAKTGRALLANGLGEAVEETTEELLADFSKACFNLVNDWRGDSTRVSAFEYDELTGKYNWSGLFDRYALSFVGGFGGGFAFGGLRRNYKLMKQISSMTHQQALQEIIYRVRNGKYDELIRDINRYQLGNKNLSAYRYEEVGDSYVLALGTPNDNLDLAVKKIAIDLINMVRDLLEATGGNISDQSFLAGLADMIKGLRHAAIINTSVAGLMLRTYNTTLSELFQLTTDVNAEKLKLKDRNGDGIITDSEESKAKLLTEAEKQSIRDKIAELESKRKEKELYLKDLIEGKKKKEFILDALFEISTGIFGREALSTFTFYAEHIEGKKISEISKDRLELLKKDYVTFKQTHSAERTHMLSLLYAEIAEKTSGLLNSAANEYNLRDLEVRRLILLFSNLNNAILLEVSKADNYLGYLQDTLYGLAEIVGTLESLDLNNIIEEIRTESNTTLLEKTNEKEELLKLLKADPENESLKDLIKRTDEEINNMLDNMRLKIYIAVLSKTPEIILSILTKYLGNLNQSILSSLYNFVNFQIGSGYYFLKQYLENHIGGAGVTVDSRSAELLNNILNNWKIGDTIYKPFSISGKMVLYEPEAFMEMLGIDNPLAVELLAFSEKYALLLLSIEDAGKNNTKLEQLINEFALSIGSPTTVTFSLLLNSFDEELRKATFLYNDLSSNSTLRSQAEEMLNLLKIFRMTIAGAKQNAVDLNTLYGYNATLNEIGGTHWAVIDDATANSFLAETDLMISKLDSIIRVYEQLEGLKLKNNDKIEVIKDTILYLKVKLIIQVEDFKSWEGYADFVAVVNSLKLHNELSSKFRLLNSEERLLFLKETIQLENAIYDLFNNPANESNLSPEKLSKLFDSTKLGDSLFINRASILGINTKDIDANTFISWLASRAAVRSSDLRKKLVEVYEDDKNSNIVPVTALEEAAFIAFSMVNNLKMLSTFIDAYKVALKETWTTLNIDDRLKLIAKITLNSDVLTIPKYRKLAETPDYLFYLMDLPRYKYAVVIEGMPGTGKTQAVFSLVYKLIQKTTPDALKKVYYIHGASEDSAKAGLAKLGLSTGHKAMDRSTFMKEIDPKWTDRTNEEKVKASELNASVNSEKEIVSNNTISATSGGPTIIFIDEISKFTLVDMSEIEEYCKLNNCIVVGAGDFNLIGCSVNITELDEPKLKDSRASSSLARTHFIGSPKLGLVLRTDNATKTANLVSLQQYIDSPLTERENIELSYSEESDGLFGDKVIKAPSDPTMDLSEEAKLELVKAVKLMVSTLKDGQKIIYLYDAVSSKDPKIYSEILSSFKDKIELMDIRAALGTEGLYYITDLVGASSGALINMLYTGISRATQGSVSIVQNEGDFSKILSTKIDSSIRMQDLSDSVRVRFTKARLKLLKSALEEFDGTTTWEIKRNTTSKSIPPVPTTVTKYAIGKDGKFSKDELVETKGDNAYELILDEKSKTGEFTIVDKDDFLTDPTTYSDCVETKGTGSIISSITPGKLELDSDGNWKVTSKVVVTLVEEGFNLGNLDILDSDDTLFTSNLTEKGSYVPHSGLSAFVLNNKVRDTRDFLIDLPSAFMTVFKASSDLLKGIVEYVGTPTDTSTVTVEEVGKITKLADGSWVITKPMKVKFEEAPITPPSSSSTPSSSTPAAVPTDSTTPSVDIPVPLPTVPTESKKKEEILSSFTEELDESEDISIPEDVKSDLSEEELLEAPSKEEIEKLDETNKNTTIDHSTIRTYSFNTFEIGGELKLTGLNTVTFIPNRFKNNPRIIGFDGLITLLTTAGHTIKSEVINKGKDNEVTTYILNTELVDFLKKAIAKIQDLARSIKPTVGSTENEALLAIALYIKNMIEDFPVKRGTRKPSGIINNNIKVTFILNQSPENYTPQDSSTPKLGDRFANDTVENTYGTFNRAPRTTINVRISIEKATKTGTNFIDVFDTPIVNLGNFASILNYLEYQNREEHQELISTWKSLKASIGDNIVELAQKIVEYLEGKDYRTIKLLAKLFLHQGRSAIILNDNWHFASYFTNLGVDFTTFKGHTAVNPGMIYTSGDPITLIDLHNDPRIVVTKVYKSIDGSMMGFDLAGNEKTIPEVCKAGHPFVFITDDLSLLGKNDEIVKRYFLQLNDSSLEKRVKLVYVLTPEYDILQYIRNIDYILNGDTENKSFIGNLFTSYKMFLKLLEKDKAGNFIHLDVVDILKIALDGSKTANTNFNNLVSIIEDLNSNSQDTIKSRLLTKGSYFGLSSEATLSGSFDYLLYKLMTPDPLFVKTNVLEFLDLVLTNPDSITDTNAISALNTITIIKKALASNTKLKPITKVYYWARALKGAKTINGLVELSNSAEINGEPLRVMGKFETSVYQGDITDLLELLDNEINTILTKDEKNRPRYYGSHTLKCADGKVRWESTKKEEPKYTVTTLKNSKKLTIKDIGSISFPNKLIEGMPDGELLKIYEFFVKLGFTDSKAILLFDDPDFMELLILYTTDNNSFDPFHALRLINDLLLVSHKVIFNNKIIKLNESLRKLITSVYYTYRSLNLNSLLCCSNEETIEISYNNDTDLIVIRKTSINPTFVPFSYNPPIEIGDFLLHGDILHYKDFSIVPFRISAAVPITIDLCNILIEQYNALSPLLKLYCLNFNYLYISSDINILDSIETEIYAMFLKVDSQILGYDSTYSSKLDFYEKNPKFVVEEDGKYFEIDLIKGVKTEIDSPVITENTRPELNMLLKIQNTLNAKGIVNNKFTSLLNKFTIDGNISENIIEELTSKINIYTKLIDRLIPNVDADLALYLNDLKLFIQDNLEKNDSCKPGF